MMQILPLSRYFNIDSKEFEKNNILNPTLNTDIPLFIDPLLLKFSKIDIFNKKARYLYEKFFGELFNDVKSYQKHRDSDHGRQIKKNIIKKLEFKEIKGLCLGYSDKNNKGRGIGKHVAEQIFSQAEFLTDNNNDKSIFDVIFLLEDGIGPDFISDMTANIIQDVLFEFTEKISKKLKIGVENFNGHYLPVHPLENTYILFVPLDILSVLPFAKNTKSVFEKFISFSNSHIIKDSINLEISDILSQTTSKTSKKSLNACLKDIIYSDSRIIKELSDFINSYANIARYDFENDNNGINVRENFLNEIDKNKTIIPTINTSNDKIKIVDNIISHFKNFLDTQNKIKKNLLYSNGEPKSEKAWQDIFNTFVYLTCEENNLDLTPEAESGNGPVDFKISCGSIFKVLIELKLSTNKKYLHGLEKQLENYKKCITNVKKSYYIYINFDEEKKFKDKLLKLIKVKNESKLNNSEIIVIDGIMYNSASNI